MAYNKSNSSLLAAVALTNYSLIELHIASALFNNEVFLLNFSEAECKFPY
jgi:hypothetical protein